MRKKILPVPQTTFQVSWTKSTFLELLRADTYQIQIGLQRWIHILFPPSQLVFNSLHEVRWRSKTSHDGNTTQCKREALLDGSREDGEGPCARAGLASRRAADWWLWCRQRRSSFPLLWSPGPRVGSCSVSPEHEWWQRPRRQVGTQAWAVVRGFIVYFLPWFTFLAAPWTSSSVRAVPSFAASRTCHVHCEFLDQPSDSLSSLIAFVFAWNALPSLLRWQTPTDPSKPSSDKTSFAGEAFCEAPMPNDVPPSCLHLPLSSLIQ